MRLAILCETFLSLDYQPELIFMLTKGVKRGALVATVIALTVFVAMLYAYLPLSVLAVWLLVHVLLSAVRVRLANRLESYAKQNHPLTTDYLKYNIAGSALSGLLWGSASWLTVLYAPEQTTYFILALLLALIAGATTTLGSVFYAHVAFTVIVSLMLGSSFLYFGGETHAMIAMLIIVAMVIMIAIESDYYRKLKKIVELSVQLRTFNADLEARVQKEVAKNLEKDIQLMHQARLAQMGETIGMIAHQWRQPLQIIASAATDMELKIRLGTAENEQCAKSIEIINRQAGHLATTMDDFRDFFKVTKEKEETSLEEVVNTALTIVNDYAENKNVTIRTELNSSETFSSYPNELKQVLLNLLKNADDALSEKGTADPQITIRTHSDAEELYFEVCDNAGGVPEEIIEKIFHAYFSTKPQEKGSGLGLYMSRMIIEEHCGGKFTVRNENGGACFRAALPK